MKNRHHILLLLKLPPPYGGGELMHQLTAESFRNKFEILTFRRRRADKASQGRLRVDNLVAGLLWMIRIARYCLKHRPRLVFLWLPKDLPAFVRTGLLAKFLQSLGIRVIGDLHGMGFDFLDQPLGRAVYRGLIHSFAALRVLGRGIAEQIRQTGYGGETAVVDNGLAAPKWVLEKPVRQPAPPLRLLYLGAISAAKGFPDVLDLLALLDQNNIDWRLTVCGEWVDDAFRRRMMQKISDVRQTERIRFVGLQLGNAKWRLLTENDFLLHFSRRDGQPLSIIEAMAAATPTIARPIGAIPEMIDEGRNGLLIRTIEQAVVELEQFLLNKEGYQSIAGAARETYFSRFTAERYLEGLEQFIKETAYAANLSIS